MINKMKPSQSDVHSLNPQSSILNPLQDLKETERLFANSIQHRTESLTNTRVTQYRKDYVPPAYLISQVDLTFELQENRTVVTSVALVKINSRLKAKVNHLELFGEELELLSIKINDKSLLSSQYEIQAHSIVLHDVPKKFKLEIKTALQPAENTALMGLYLSRGIFCTQCEAEGFRRITYFLDRPDVLAHYTTTLIADKQKYPVLLSNGNLFGSGDMVDGLHWVKWHDPFPKPSYLFALVAGDLDFIEDYFMTRSMRRIALRIFSEKGQSEKCEYAMLSLKKAMRWDEENYGREYDLDTFMIVAISDFNFGAMENKGLNIFNAKNVFADPATATDEDYNRIDSVIAHEYFHNWSGNRVTCRDWFQLSLKEGLTVFRDECFCEDIGSAAIERIDEVEFLRSTQFLEDDGPLSHPIRPDSYIEINNFYTATVYDKGAEVIRMLQTLLGKTVFRSAMDAYFKEFDGKAVTCDDFLDVMEKVSRRDLSQFRLWYSQAGTPKLFVATKYDAENERLFLTVNQECLTTISQPEKNPMCIPLKIGLVDLDGKDIPLLMLGEEKKIETTKTVLVTHEEQTFTFLNIKAKPIPSLLRDFSSPVKLFYSYRDEELASLMAHDGNAFSRWEASNIYAERVAMQLASSRQSGRVLELPNLFLKAFGQVLQDDKTDKALIARMLQLPSEVCLSEGMAGIDVEGVHAVREWMHHQLANHWQKEFEHVFEKNCLNHPYEYSVEEMARRSLKNTCLGYLARLATPQILDRIAREYYAADNMTDRMAILKVLTNIDCSLRETLLNEFYHCSRGDDGVIDKWFSLQAESTLPDAIERVQALQSHERFDIKNPNRVRALWGSFARQNFLRFHDLSGRGYRLIAEAALRLDKINPMMAVRLIEPMSRWRRFDDVRQELMKMELEQICLEPGLSKDLYEIVSKSLA